MYLALRAKPMISIAASPRAQSGVCRGRNGELVWWPDQDEDVGGSRVGWCGPSL